MLLLLNASNFFELEELEEETIKRLSELLEVEEFNNLNSEIQERVKVIKKNRCWTI